MSIKKQLKRLSHVFVAILVMAIANHCVFEDAFASVSQVVFGAELTAHHANHLGAGTKHSHDEDGPPHKHGQQHACVLVIKPEQNGFEASKILSGFAPVLVIQFLAEGLRYVQQSLRTVESLFLDDLPNVLLSLTYALVFAPQAPPI